MEEAIASLSLMPSVLLLLLPQLVWILSALCGTRVCVALVYERPRRSGEDGTSARTESEYTCWGKQRECLWTAWPWAGKHSRSRASLENDPVRVAQCTRAALKRAAGAVLRHHTSSLSCTIGLAISGMKPIRCASRYTVHDTVQYSHDAPTTSFSIKNKRNLLMAIITVGN